MSNDLTENHESGSILGKVVEIKRPVEVFFGTAFYAPTSGLGRIEAYSGVKFEVIEAMEDGRYLCRSVDRSFDKATLVKALADIKPWLRGRFGGITGYTLPLDFKPGKQRSWIGKNLSRMTNMDQIWRKV